MGTTVSKQTMYRSLGRIDIYSLKHVRCDPLTTTHCLQRLTWRIEHIMCGHRHNRLVCYFPTSFDLARSLINIRDSYGITVITKSKSLNDTFTVA
ncbi:hypothetical protein TNCV_4927351 [Trichonephila clavipes]|nr:hypothetical protein TNCV_4927351 [Trichonephila clavipes]